MGAINVLGVNVTLLSRVTTKGGDVLHVMKQTDNGYLGFGEAYFSWIEARVVKGWKRHTRMTMNLVVPVGHVRFVFASKQNENATNFRVEEIGEARYARITVEPGVWFAFQGLSNTPSLVLNIANVSHSSDEIEKLDLEKMNYEWS